MNIHHITECFSPSSVTVHRRLCLSFFRTWSFTLSKNDLDPNDNSNSASSFPTINSCGLLFSLRDHNGLPRSIMSFFFFQNNVLGLLKRETWLELVCPCPRSDNGKPRSIIHRFISFPLLRRPSFVIIPPWVACWVHVTVYNGSPRSIIFLSFRTPWDLTSIAFLPRAFWRRRWQSWGSPCNKTHHWPWFRCDSFFSLAFSCVLFAIPSEQSVELKRLMLNKDKRWFHSSRVKFPLVRMSASWFLVSMYLLWILGSKLILLNNQSRATLWVLETCLIVGLLPFIIILITASLSSNTYNKASWCENSTFEGTHGQH